jgi:hypothetical protein
MEDGQVSTGHGIVGGVDTYKDLHVAAVVDEHDRVLESQCFATTRHGYKEMLAWMRSFDHLRAYRSRVYGHLWRRAEALPTKRWSRSARGHHARQA